MNQTRLLHFVSVWHWSTLYEKSYVGSMTALSNAVVKAHLHKAYGRH